MSRWPPILLLILACSAAVPAGRAFLVLSPKLPEIDVDPGSAGRDGLRLPELEFHFAIEARCPDTQQPRSLMLSIADSRKRVMASALQTALGSGLSLTVPSQQIAPVAVGTFCSAERSDDRQYVTVKGLLSAQGALSCASDSEKSITYASTSLDVRLRCERQPGVAGNGVELR